MKHPESGIYSFYSFFIDFFGIFYIFKIIKMSMSVFFIFCRIDGMIKKNIE